MAADNATVPSGRNETAVAAEDATESTILAQRQVVEDESAVTPSQIGQNAAVAADADIAAAEDAVADKLLILVGYLVHCNDAHLADCDFSVNDFLNAYAINKQDCGMAFEDAFFAAMSEWTPDVRVFGLNLNGKAVATRDSNHPFNSTAAAKDGGCGSDSRSSAVTENATVVAENAHPPPHPGNALCKEIRSTFRRSRVGSEYGSETEAEAEAETEAETKYELAVAELRQWMQEGVGSEETMLRNWVPCGDMYEARVRKLMRVNLESIQVKLERILVNPIFESKAMRRNRRNLRKTKREQRKRLRHSGIVEDPEALERRKAAERKQRLYEREEDEVADALEREWEVLFRSAMSQPLENCVHRLMQRFYMALM